MDVFSLTVKAIWYIALILLGFLSIIILVNFIH